VACLAILLVLLVGSERMHRAHSSSYHFSSEQICQRALHMASTFGGPVQVMEPPCLYGHTPSLRQAQWLVTCQAGNLKVYLTFVDDTGRLCNVGVIQDKHTTLPMVAPIRTAAQAREVALHRLHDLELLPADGIVTLAHPPNLIHSRWCMVWAIQSSHLPQPYHLMVVMDSYTGLPWVISEGA
jgi:hypothetical protein